MPSAYIVFEDSPSIGTRLFKKHFRHVSVVLPHKDNTAHYTYINPLPWGVEVRPLLAWQVDRMIEKQKYSEVEVLAVPMGEFNKRYRTGLPTCVELVKRCVGLHAPFVLTPYQLYKHILKEYY